jgi:hypothetical protein
MQERGAESDEVSARQSDTGPGAGAAGSGDGWDEIARMIDRQLRRDVARRTGMSEAASWGEIRSALLERLRVPAERADIERRVEEVGREVEERLRGGMAQAAGAGRDADWAIIGRTLRERVTRLLEPARPPFPGGSGTGESLDDASVPAARETPDRGPRPPQLGGEDTGLPTVTENVDKLPGQEGGTTGSTPGQTHSGTQHPTQGPPHTPPQGPA